MTDGKLYTSLSTNTIMAKLTNQFQQTRLITSSPDKHYSLDSEDDFRSSCRNISHQQQLFSELPSPGRSHFTIYWYTWLKTIYNEQFLSELPSPERSLAHYTNCWFSWAQTIYYLTSSSINSNKRHHINLRIRKIIPHNVSPSRDNS